MMTRREALRAALFGGAAMMTVAASVRAQQMPAAPVPVTPTEAPPAGPFTVPPLPYAYEALEPYIDTTTMHLHHDKHHAAYVANLNKAVAKYPDLQKKTVAELLTGLNTLPEDIRTMVRNNGGGHYNHSLFWQMMSGKGGAPSGDLAAALNTTFGSYDKFQTAFTEAATKQFGSGWAWLSLGPGGVLQAEGTPNQDSPLLQGRVPLLGLDVWEHAYYLKYQNRRPEYIQAWYHVVNWDFVADRYRKAKVGAIRA